MMRGFLMMALLGIVASATFAQEQGKGTKVTINEDGVLLIDGKKTLVIGTTMPPHPDAKSHTGRPAWEEIREGGIRFLRTGPWGEERPWNDDAFAMEDKYLETAVKYDMYCMPFLKEYSGVDPGSEKERRLRELINRYKDHPGLAIWKGADEPEWGNYPIPPLIRAREVIEELDPHHPIWIVQAPRGTEESLRAYDPTYHITGVDVYPVGYPPGNHSWLPNDDISVVGDHINIMMRVADGKPVWATLQIAWSGVTPARGRTLRYPTFEQLRYMTYQSLVLGSRGLIYFGGHLESTLNERDRELGWNWTYWDRVLRPVLEEVNENSPLHEALLAPNSELPIHAPDLEYVVREVGDEIFIIATRRHGDTKQITFLGLPDGITEGDVLFEEPRKVTVTRDIHPIRPGRGEVNMFTDWFAPFDVHVYRFKRGKQQETR